MARGWEGEREKRRKKDRKEGGKKRRKKKTMWQTAAAGGQKVLGKCPALNLSSKGPAHKRAEY